MLTLIQLNPDERQKPQTFRLPPDGAHLIGRRHGDVQLVDSRISRQHAEVSVQNGTWVIRDLSSSNGTWVNGERIEGLCELEEGDRLVVGRITLIVGHVDVLDSTNPAAAGESVADDLLKGGAKHATAEQDDADSDTFDLDAALDLEPIDFDFDQEASDDASAESVGVGIDPATATPGEPTGRADGEPEAAAARGDDDWDLNDTAEHHAVGPGESSLAPASTTPDITGPAIDDAHEEDEYAAAVGFITPATRPDSPLDNLNDSGDKTGDADASAAGESDDFDYEDDAPAIVGLSLELPAPDAELAAGEGGEGDAEVDPLIEGDAAALEDWLDDDEPEAQGLAADADSSAQDTGLDHELEHAAGDDNDAAPVPTAGASVATPTSAAAESADPREPDLVDSEDQQELEPAWSSKSSSRKKGLLALVLLALAAGGGFWMINASGTDTPIAGVTPGTNDAALADDGPEAAAVPNPQRTNANPAPHTDTPAAPDLGPTTSTKAVVAAGDASAATTKSDAFGQAPTLAVPAPRTAATPRASTPPFTATPTEVAAAEPPAPTLSPAVETIPDTPGFTGPTLALLDPTPTPDPLLTIRPAAVTDLPEPAIPAATAPARRIVFVIDASGSMVDSMNQGALTWLEQRLESLTDQDEFTVLFFRSNEVIEVPPMGLKSAGSLNRDRALAWVSPDAGNIRPRGKSEPLIALQQAQGYQPTDIYILSDDKFGHRGAAAAVEARDLEQLLGTPPATVHTVQFFYPNPDDRRLEDIAQRFGGTYEFVKEPPFDLDPNNDLGVDLLGISR